MKGERAMATMVIHWKDKDIRNMEIKNTTYKRGRWFNHQNINGGKRVLV